MGTDRDQQLARAKQQAVEPWDHLRGVGHTDYNNHLILIRASVEETAAVLARGAARWEKDVLGKEVLKGGLTLVVFRLRGHVWTEILGDPVEPSELSRDTHSPVIWYGCSDTGGTVAYQYYEDGVRLEYLNAVCAGRSRPYPRESCFESSLRSLKLRDIKNAYDFAHQFLVERDAFEPGLEHAYFFPEKPRRGPSPSRKKTPSLILPEGAPQEETPTPRLWTPDSVPEECLQRVMNPGIVHVIGEEEVRMFPAFERVDLVVLTEKVKLLTGV